MRISILERVLIPQRDDSKRLDSGQLTPPVAAQVPSNGTDGPWVSSNSKARLVPTYCKDSRVLKAFFRCPIDDEDKVLESWFHELWALSTRLRWENRVSTRDQAIEVMQRLGLHPTYLVMPLADMKLGMSEADVDKLSLAKGYVTEVDNLKVISARRALLSGCAMLFASRCDTGCYTRIEDFLAISWFRADRSVFLIRS